MKILSATIIFLITLSFSKAEFTSIESNIEKAKWLIGTWELSTPRGSIFEEWKEVSENEFRARSYKIEGKDTIFLETIRIYQLKNTLFYAPTVVDQNEQKEVPFKGTYLSANKMIFENSEHDFPQKISYTRVGKDQLVAEISGPSKNGEFKYQTFSMKRKRDSISKNVELAKSVFRYFNEHNWVKMASLYADPTEFRDPSFGIEAVIQSREKIIDKYMKLNKIAPDIKDEISTIYTSGENYVIVEFISSGTASDGSKWSLPIVSIFTIENNIIVKEFTYYDK